MNRILLSMCGAAILGLSTIATGASASPLANAGGTINNAASNLQGQVEDVRWRRVCRPVPRWVHGRRIFVQRCNNVWVGPPRGPRYYGRPHGPPPRYYGGNWRRYY
ncbi:hypothetical protein ACLBXM_07690 [Xanthobacteraceae bacterium A53D]